MIQNNEKVHCFGFDQTISKNSHRQKDTDKMFYLPRITAKHDSILNVSKLPGLTDLYSYASNSRATSRKLSMRPQAEMYTDNLPINPVEIGFRHNLPQGSESERPAIERRSSSPYKQDSDPKHLLSLEWYNANYARKIQLKPRDKTLKTDQSTSTTESSLHIPDRTKSLFSKVDIGLNPLRAKYPGQHMNDFLSMNDSLHVRKPAYNILKPKHCVNEPTELSNVDASFQASPHKQDKGYEDVNEDSINLKPKNSVVIPSSKVRLGNIGIHMINREAYSAKKRTKNFRASSVLDHERYDRSPKTKENSQFEQQISGNTERQNVTILTSRQEDENIKNNSEFEHLFNLMKDKVISEKKNKYFSVEFSQSKRKFGPSKVIPKIQKPIYQNYGKFYEPNSFETSQEMEISKLKIYPQKDVQVLVNPITVVKKPAEDIFVPATLKTSNEKIKPYMDNDLQNPVKDEVSKRNEIVFTKNSQNIDIEGATSKENKISKQLTEPPRKSSSPPKRKIVNKEVSEQTRRESDECELLVTVGKEASMKALEKQLLIQQGKHDSIHGWSDKEIFYESAL